MKETKDRKSQKAAKSEASVYTGTNRGEKLQLWQAEEYCSVYDTKIGKLTIVSDGEALLAVRLSACTDIADAQRSAVSDNAAIQLEEYFRGKRQIFDIPLRPKGTAFQQLVWEKLGMIPYGETKSYKQVAEMIGKPGASRAVGMANNKNPIMIFIPCHRVIGSDGSLVGYAAGLTVKERLLNLEKEHIMQFAK